MPERVTLCVIPARGGSKRLPRKNLAPFEGRPILAHTIEAARACGDLFARIVVSTEDAEIAAVARAHGAAVDARSPALATDAARVVDVCLALLDREAAEGRRYDALCCLYATAPLRTADDIRAVVGLLDPGRCDFALAVARYDLPPHQALRRAADGGLVAQWPELIERRAADVGDLVCDNGSTYAALTAAFRTARSFFGPRLRGHVMPRWRSVDIDLPEDLAMARLLAEHRSLWQKAG